MSDEGLRYRGSTNPDEQPPEPPPKPNSGDDDSQGKGKGEGFVTRMARQYLPQVLKLLRHIETFIEICMIIYGHISTIYNKFYEKVKDHHPEEIMKLITGLVLMFFGGFFITTVAVFEAFKQGGADRLQKNLHALREQAKAVAEANEADDKVDDDGDGIADVLQISKEELAQRKFLVMIRACDPQKVSNALSALYTATLAAMATLRVQFARTISLGAAIGDYIFKPVNKFVIPVIVSLTPEDYHKWYPSVFGYICRAIGASIAFQIQRILSTVATSVRGGHMVLESSAALTQAHGISYLTDGFLDDILVWIAVVMGIYFQIFVFTYLPFILKLGLFPFFFVEWFLTTMVTTVPV